MVMERDTLHRIGTRLKVARDRRGLTQVQLARLMGLEHRQSLAAIESGQRRLSADELLRAIRALDVDLDYFTDSFRLVGEGRFSFRANSAVTEHTLDRFEDRAGGWIATYRALGAEAGGSARWLSQRLALAEDSSFEEAQAAAESLRAAWRLGDRPARSLRPAMERELGALVLFIDAPPGISGAASQLSGLNCVLVNRRETEGRRNFDLAHELFHLLTWDAMPPARVERTGTAAGGRRKRVEQLAENFAAALLMPAAAFGKSWTKRDPATDLHRWLSDAAADFHVSPSACKWRLTNLGHLDKKAALAIDEQRLAHRNRIAEPPPAPELFSKPFVERIAAALDEGRLSVKRTASLLGISLEELSDLLRSYGFEPSFEA
jgi:Zn-dependent peptidase ImmA (M78 family)/DNA-binding XRE family transcriptional regulator